ncbi:MAG: hypothetical protein K8T20_05120 [Planctomycetes bacterium]|nr:hypothetical protein [Planctomycetota bacterium]
MTCRDRALMLAACVVTSLTATLAMNLYFHGNAVAEDPKTTDTIRVKRLEIVDADGDMKMVLATAKDTGMPVIAMIDGGGKVRYTVALNADGSGAQVFTDTKGKPRIGLAINADGSGAVTFSDAKGNNLVALASSDAGSGLNLSDKAGTVRASLGIGSDGSPSFRTYDEEGKELKGD